MTRLGRSALLPALALLLAACGEDSGSAPTASIQPSATSSSSSPVTGGTDAATATPAPLLARGAVEPGTYHVPSSAWSVAGYTITLPEGWQTQYGHTFIKHSDQPGELGFYFVMVHAIFSDPCLEDYTAIDVGPSVDDLATALLEQPFVDATQPVDTTLGGLPAKRIDLSVPADLDAAACRMGEHLQIWYSAPADKFFVLLGDDTASVYILDVEGERQVFLTHYRAPATPDDVTEMQMIVDSIEIDS